METPPPEVINETELPDDTPIIVESIQDVEAAVPAAEETQESGPTEPPQITYTVERARKYTVALASGRGVAAGSNQDRT